MHLFVILDLFFGLKYTQKQFLRTLCEGGFSNFRKKQVIRPPKWRVEAPEDSKNNFFWNQWPKNPNVNLKYVCEIRAADPVPVFRKKQVFRPPKWRVDAPQGSKNIFFEISDPKNPMSTSSMCVRAPETPPKKWRLFFYRSGKNKVFFLPNSSVTVYFMFVCSFSKAMALSWTNRPIYHSKALIHCSIYQKSLEKALVTADIFYFSSGDMCRYVPICADFGTCHFTKITIFWRWGQLFPNFSDFLKAHD